MKKFNNIAVIHSFESDKYDMFYEFGLEMSSGTITNNIYGRRNFNILTLISIVIFASVPISYPVLPTLKNLKLIPSISL